MTSAHGHDRQPVTAADLRELVAVSAAALRHSLTADWSERAGTLAWSRRQTVEHAADCLLSYAVQLAYQAPKRFVPYMAGAEDNSTDADLVEFFEAAGMTLAAVVESAPATARGYHPSGVADAEGFAAMGCVEALVHTYDVTLDTGASLRPRPAPCARVTARLFPEVAPHDDPWLLLLWTTGRADIPGRDRVTRWRWHGEPVT